MKIICTKCNVEKDSSEFNHVLRSKTGFDWVCRTCRNEYRNKNRHKYKDHEAEYSKRYSNIKSVKAHDRWNNKKEYLSKQHKEWKNLNPDYYKNYGRIYDSNRRLVDPKYKMIKNYRCCIIGAIKRNRVRTIKKSHSLDLIGCKWEEAIAHIEKQFKNGMQWDNHGKVWHIDHIIPLSFFNLENETEQRLAFYYGNLQPLFCSENISKGKNLINSNFIY